jgi:hypothetical protein
MRKGAHYMPVPAVFQPFRTQNCNEFLVIIGFSVLIDLSAIPM